MISGLCLPQDTCRDKSEWHLYLAEKNPGVKDLKQEAPG